MDAVYKEPSGIVIDEIKILTEPVERNYSNVVFPNDDIFLKNMNLNKNVSVRFDTGAVLKGHGIKYTVRKDTVQMIQSLLKMSIPVYVCASQNLLSFCEHWNKQCYDENVEGSVKAIIIPETISRWHNVDCIGVTDRLLKDTQMHFMYEGAGVPCAMVTGYGITNQKYPVVRYSASFAGVITVSDEPFELK